MLKNHSAEEYPQPSEPALRSCWTRSEGKP